MNHGLEGEDHLNDEEYARVHGFREPMSEAEEQSYWEIDHPPRCHACEDGGSRHSDQCEFWEPSEAAIRNAQPEWVPEFDELSLERAFRVRGYRILRSPGDTVGEPIKVQSDPYVEMYRKLYGDEVLSIGLSLLKRLRGDVWRTQEGLELTAPEMTPSHASNLKVWLERRARPVLIAAQLEAGCAEIDHDGGMHAHDAIEEMANELLEIDPLDHLRRLKLYQAICKRATQVFVRG